MSRSVKIAVGTLVALPALLVVVGLLLYAFPAWPLRWAASFALPHVNASIRGEIEIDAIDAENLGAIELEGARLRDDDGTVVLALPRVRLDWQPLALVDSVVKVDAIELASPRVDLTARDDETLRLAHALEVATPTPDMGDEESSAAPLPVSVSLGALLLENGTLKVSETRDEPIELTAGASLSRRRSLSGDAELVHGADTARLKDFALSLPTLTGRAALSVHLSVETLQTVEAKLRCPVELEAKVARADESAPWTIEARSESESFWLTLSSTLSGAFVHQRSELRLGAASLQRCHADAPPGEGAIAATAEGPFDAIRASVPELRWQYDEVDARGSVRSIAVSPGRVRVAGLDLRAGSDRITAEAQLDPRAIWAPGGYARGDIILRDFDRFSALSPIPIAGSLDAHVDLRMEDALRGSASLRARNLAVSGLEPLNVDGSVEGEPEELSYRLVARRSVGVGGRLVARGSTRTEQLRARPSVMGFLDGSQVQFEIERLNPASWLSVDGSETSCIDGELRWDGRALDARLEAVTRLSELGALEAQLELHIDRAELRIAVDAQHGSGARMTARLGSDTSLERLLGARPEMLTWRLEAQLRSLDWEALAPWMPASVMVQGPVELDVNLALDALRPSGTVALRTEVDLSRPLWPTARAELETELSSGRANTTLVIRGPLEARVDASTPIPERVDELAGVDLEALLQTRAVFRIHGDDLSLLQDALSLDALDGEFDLEGSYRDRALESSLDFELRRVSSAIPPTRGTVRARIDTTSTLDAELEVADGTVTVAADSPLSFQMFLDPPTSPPVVDVSLALEGLHLDGLMPRARLPRTSAGLLEGQARVHYDGVETTASGALQVYGGILGGTVLREANLDFGVDAGIAKASVNVAAGQKGRLQFGFEQKLGETPSTRIRLIAQEFSLAWVREVSTALRRSEFVDGRLNADLDLVATAEGASVDGELRLSDGVARVAGQLPLLRNVALDARFGGVDSRFDLTADAAGGKIDLHANKANLSAGRLEGELTLKDVPLSIDRLTLRTSIQVGVIARVDARGADIETEIRSGRILVLRLDKTGLHSTSGLSYVRYVDEEEGRGEAEKRSAAKVPGTVELAVRTLEPVTIAGELARTSLEVELRGELRGGDTRLDGTVRLPDGSVQVGPHRYQVERAVVAFNGGRELDPSLDVSLLKEFREPPTSFFVKVTGTARAPRLRFESDPPLYDQSQLVGFFAGGSPGDTGGDIDAAAVAGVAAGLLTSQLQDELRGALPVDTVEIDVGEGGESASLTTGKWLSPDLYVAYRVGVASEGSAGGNTGPSNTGILHYRLTPRWTLEMQVKPGEQSSGSADLIWVKRF